jgi:hypothetical protein
VRDACSGQVARTGTCWHPQNRQCQNGCSWYSRGHGIDENIKEKAAQLEKAGQSSGTFRITSGKLLDSVLGGKLTEEARQNLQAVKVLQDPLGCFVRQ